MIGGSWFRRFLLATLSLATAVLVAAVAVLVILVGDANDRDAAAREALLSQSLTNERLVLELRGLVEQGQTRDAERVQVVDEAIEEILDELRLSVDCLHIHEERGRWPAPCEAVKERVARLGRGLPLREPQTAPPATTTTTTTPVTTTNTTTPPAPPEKRCLLGIICL